ncbi:MAG: redoxin family protein [Planctomycetia bacterium]|nr:redoxin family protein [Planctomycetia bacterium]
MYRIFSLIVISMSIFFATDLSRTNAQDNDQPAIPDSLSLDSLLMPAEPLDESLFVIPEKATAQELLNFVEELSAKIPQPKTQAEMLQLTEKMTQTCLDVAEKILAMSEITDEERDQAIQLKVVALTAKSRTDESAIEELTKFVDNLIQTAKDEAAKVNAYQLKLQVLVAQAKDETVLDQVNQLADEILALEEDELKVLGLEIRAKSFLSRSQKEPEALNEFLAFMNDFLAKPELSTRVLERAQEIKLYALLAASQNNPEKVAELDNYFDEVLAKDLSPESKTSVYQLRLQSLMNNNSEAANSAENNAKVLALAERLLKEETPELQAMGRAVKNSILVKEAQEDASKVDALFKFADEILATATDSTAKEQAHMTKIQGFAIQSKDNPEANKELLAYIEKLIVDEKPTGNFLNHLAQIKIQVLLHQMLDEEGKVPSKEDISAVENALTEYADLEDLKQLISAAQGIVFVSKISNLAENNGSIDDLNAIFSEIEKTSENDPALIVLLFESQESVNGIQKIGKQNNDANLYEKTLLRFIEFCKNSSNEQIKSALSYLEDLQKLNNLVGKSFAFEGIVAGSEDNKVFNSSEFQGKVYMIDVWSTNNATYFDLIEDIKDMYNEYKEKGFEIVGVNTDSNTQILTRAIEVLTIPWTVVSAQLTEDAQKTIPDEFAAAKSGTMILVDKDGKVAAVSSNIEEIRSKLNELLK